MTVAGYTTADGGLLVVVEDSLGRRVGDVETLADPFSPRVRRDVAWLCQKTGCDRRDAWRVIWAAFVREAAA